MKRPRDIILVHQRAQTVHGFPYLNSSHSGRMGLLTAANFTPMFSICDKIQRYFDMLELLLPNGLQVCETLNLQGSCSPQCWFVAFLKDRKLGREHNFDPCDESCFLGGRSRHESPVECPRGTHHGAMGRHGPSRQALLA